MGTIDVSGFESEESSDAMAAQAAHQVLSESESLQRLMEEASRPGRELAEQAARLNQQTLNLAERLREEMRPGEKLSRQLSQMQRSFAVPLQEMLRRNGIEPDHLSKLAEVARSQSRISRDIVENARRLPMPPSLVHHAETYQRDVEDSLHQVEELQELESVSGEDEDTSDDIAVRMLRQSEVQTELAHRQAEVFGSMLKVLEDQLKDSREGERSANVRWRWATGVAAAGLVATILSLLVALGQG